MTVFLFILKMIGITLLSLLILALILLLIILFVPIRYKLKGTVRAEENLYDVFCDFTWILHMFHGNCRYLRSAMEDETDDPEKLNDQGFHYELRLFHFIRLLPKEERDEDFGPEDGGPYSLTEYYPEDVGKREEPADIPGQAAAEEAPMDSPPAEEPSEEAETPEEAEIPEETETPEETEIPEETETPEETDTTEGAGSQEEETTDEFKESIPDKLSEKIKEFGGFLKRLLRKVKDTKENAGYKINDICDKIDKLREESTKEAIELLIAEALRILRAIKPRKYKVDLEYGFGDPALTGEITGILSMIFLSSGKRVSLKPDFDRSVLDGDMFFKGGLKIITIVIVLWRLYFSKDFRKFYREFRR